MLLLKSNQQLDKIRTILPPIHLGDQKICFQKQQQQNLSCNIHNSVRTAYACVIAINARVSHSIWFYNVCIADQKEKKNVAVSRVVRVKNIKISCHLWQSLTAKSAITALPLYVWALIYAHNQTHSLNLNQDGTDTQFYSRWLNCASSKWWKGIVTSFSTPGHSRVTM